MASLIFLDKCSDRLAFNEEPLTFLFSQLVHLKTKNAKFPPFIPPKYPDLFEALNPYLNKYEKLASKKKIAAKVPKNPKDLQDLMEKYWLGTPYQNLLRLPNKIQLPMLPVGWASGVEFGLILTYLQTWVPRGYNRGELLNSICLAPGEEATIEIFTWDRQRLEQERVEEVSRESQLTGSITGRTSLETVLSTRFKVGAGAEAGGDVSLDLKDLEIPATVGANAGVNLDSEFEASLQQTTQQVTEATRTAAHTMRATRKIRVAETCERGSENRITRKIANTNRCHAVNYDYFEILESFDVSFALNSVQLGLLIPLPQVVNVDPDWLLCHEHIIRPYLPAPILADGFAAARLLKAAAVFRSQISPTASPTGPAPVEGGAGAEPKTSTNPIRELLKPYVDAIVQADQTLRRATLDPLQDVLARSLDINFDNNPSTVQWNAAKKEAGQWLFRQELLLVDADFSDQVDRLKTQCDAPDSTCETPLTIFISDTFFLTTALEIDKIKQLLGLPVAYNDAGLTAALVSARQALGQVKNIQVLPPGATAQVPEISEVSSPSTAAQPRSVEEMVGEAFGQQELAFARVDFERLRCHVLERLEFYLGLILSDRGPTAWLQLLAAYPHAAEMAEPRLVAVSRGYAIFPLRPSFQKRFEEENKNLLDNVRKDLGEQSKPEPVVLPTHGMVLEARLGECSGCEDFIQEHRKLDLEFRQEEVNKARNEAAQAEAETRRYEARLVSSPPLLDDPTPESPQIKVTVTTEEGT